MRPAVALRMQPSRALHLQAAKALRMQASPVQMLRQSKMMRMPVPKEEQSAHTISQRIRSLKKVPVELLPLAFVMVVAIGAAVYSMGNKLVTDKQLRLTRSGAQSGGKGH